MNKAKQWFIILFAAGLATFAFSAPTVLNNIFRMHAQTEASFPAATPSTLGGLLFGTTAGVPYWSPGDGGAWQTFGGSSTATGGLYSREDAGLMGYGPEVQSSEGTKYFYADAGSNATGMNGVVVVINTQATGSSNVAFGNPETGVTTPTIGGFVGYNEQSVAAGTTGHTVLAAGVGRGVRLTTNAAINLDCHGQSCGVGGTVGAPATATLLVGDIGVAGVNINITSGNNAWAILTNGGRGDFGSGLFDYIESNGTTVSTPAPFSAGGDLNTAGVFTRAGVEIAQPTITSATSIASILTANFELGGIRFQTPATFTRFGQTTLVTGVGAGNLTIEVYNNTAAAVVCTRTLSCTLALGMSSANCTGTVAAADDVVLRIDASACTTSPIMSLTAMYR